MLGDSIYSHHVGATNSQALLTDVVPVSVLPTYVSPYQY